MTLETKRESIFNVCCLLFCSIQELISCLLTSIGLCCCTATQHLHESHADGSTNNCDHCLCDCTVLALTRFEYVQSVQPLRRKGLNEVKIEVVSKFIKSNLIFPSSITKGYKTCRFKFHLRYIVAVTAALEKESLTHQKLRFLPLETCLL